MGRKLQQLPAETDSGPKEVADVFGVSETTVKRRLRAGELPGYRNGKLWRRPPKRLDEFRTKNQNA